jgi:hypothetical protein
MCDARAPFSQRWEATPVRFLLPFAEQIQPESSPKPLGGIYA